MSDWHESLTGTRARVWQTLARGVADRRSPARHPVLATRGLAEGAEARIVVLRAVETEAHSVEVQTDRRSGKVAELEAHPVCSLLVWDVRSNLQIRLRGTARLVTGDADAWARVPDAARRVYGGTPPPGAILKDPSDHVADADLAEFVRVVVDVSDVETLHLGPDRHRRALFTAPEWRGCWVAP